MKKVSGKTAFFLLLTTLLLSSGCGKQNAPGEIKELGSVSFSRKYSGSLESLSKSYYFPLFFTTVEQQIKIAPQSKTIWQCNIFITEIPGRGDPVRLAEEYFTEIFGVIPQEVSGLKIEFSRAFDHGPKGVKISFTHLKNAVLAEAEKNLPEVQLFLEREKLYQRMQIIASALEEHFLDTGKYPEFLLELKISSGNPKWNGPYLQEIPADLSGGDFIYKRQEQKYSLYTVDTEGKKLIYPAK